MAIILPVICVALLVAADQVSKYYAATYLAPIGTHNLIRGFFSLTYVENSGAAFGLMQGGRMFFIPLTIIVLIAVCFYYISLPKGGRVNNLMRAALVLVMAGAIGNFIDRVRNGYVVDFFHAIFIDFPVFNLADIFVVIGTFALVILMLFFVKSPAKEEKV
ncbi:MAG: signal peptidase II [Clostridiales bacterium]|jgi:signal peptidase II|nr:signal peptidase II [Clostridiales bacterium]